MLFQILENFAGWKLENTGFSWKWKRIQQDPLFVVNMQEDEKKKITPFLLNRWLSMNESMFPIALMMNSLVFDITLEEYYKIVLNICTSFMPEGAKIRFQWIKKESKDNTKEIPDDIIGMVSTYHSISFEEARENINITKEIGKINEYLNGFPIEDKKKKLLGMI